MSHYRKPESFRCGRCLQRAVLQRAGMTSASVLHRVFNSHLGKIQGSGEYSIVVHVDRVKPLILGQCISAPDKMILSLLIDQCNTLVGFTTIKLGQIIADTLCSTSLVMRGQVACLILCALCCSSLIVRLFGVESYPTCQLSFAVIQAEPVSLKKAKHILRNF